MSASPRCPHCGHLDRVGAGPTLSGDAVSLCLGCRRVALAVDWTPRMTGDFDCCLPERTEHP